MQLFGGAGQWASLVNVSELLAPHSSKLCNSTWTEDKSGSQPSAIMLLKNLAIWLGKQVGVTLTHVAKLEEYAVHALAKIVVKSEPSSIFPRFLLFFLILLVHILPFCHTLVTCLSPRITHHQ